MKRRRKTCRGWGDLLFDTSTDGELDDLDLLGDHRQHFEFDSVEFVETRPRTCLRQTLEELAHRLVIETVRTVEDDTLKTRKNRVKHVQKYMKMRGLVNYLFCNGFRQIFACLCLSGSGWTFRRSAQVEFKRTHECSKT